MRVDHAEDEQSEACGPHDAGFEPEEFAELIWAECAEWEVDEPEEEEG